MGRNARKLSRTGSRKIFTSSKNIITPDGGSEEIIPKRQRQGGKRPLILSLTLPGSVKVQVAAR